MTVAMERQREFELLQLQRKMAPALQSEEADAKGNSTMDIVPHTDGETTTETSTDVTSSQQEATADGMNNTTAGGTTTTTATDQRVWQSHCQSLTEGAWEHFAVKRDRHGVYAPTGEAYWSTSELTRDNLAAHFAGELTLGCGSTSTTDQCLWVALDLDNHVDDIATNKNHDFAIVVMNRLAERGVQCLIEHSDGKGGIHLWVLFSQRVPAADAHRYAKWIARDYAEHGLDKCECFPKQASVKHTEAKCGNYLRLPGKHHKRDHWSQFWGDGDWLDADQSVQLLMHPPLNDPACLAHPPAEAPKPVIPYEQTSGLIARDGRSNDAAVVERARKYVAKIPGAVSEQHGHDATFSVACTLVIGFDLTKSQALDVLAEWNTTCQPPWTEADLLHKIDGADKQPGERGQLLNASDNPNYAKTATGTKSEQVDTDSSSVGSGPVVNVITAPTTSVSLTDQERVRVYVDDNEMATNDNVIDALAGTRNLFQMDGRLVQLVRPPKTRVSVSDVMVPHYLTPALLRERITNRVVFFGYDAKSNEVARSIPKFCAETIHQRGVWNGVPHLVGIVASPVLRPDGSVLQTSGYDVASQLFVDLPETYPAVPHAPTAAEVEAAVTMLLDLVCDFPFVNDAHRAAWLAAILTPLAKHTHDGVTGPVILFDAPSAGSGKTILAELGGIIVIGNEPPSMIWKHGETERSKVMLAKLMQRPQIIFLDNVECELGGPTINKCVTDRTYEDRVLQKTENAQLPVLAQIWVTGNNVEVVEDTRRRVCHCRIEPHCEQPEKRKGFKHKDVKGYARKNRKKLLCAALTILRGYFSAGKPKQDLIPWGSFEGWSSIVRSSLVWAGLPDVGECMMSDNTQDDELLTGLECVVAAFRWLDPEFDGLTTKRITEVLQSEQTTPGRDDLVQAFNSLTDKPISKIGSRQVGAALKKLKSKVFGEYKLTSGRDKKRRFWVLRPVQKMTSMTSMTSPSTNPIRTETKNIGVMDSGPDSEGKEETPVFLTSKATPAFSGTSLTSLMSLEDRSVVTPLADETPSIASPEDTTLSDDDLEQIGELF